MRAAGAADPPAAEVAHAGSSTRLVGRAAAFAAAEGYARCRAGLRSSAPAVPPLSLFSELGLGAGEASRRLAGGGRRPARGARGGGRLDRWRCGVDCGLISENFRGLFENKFERGEWTAGCISRKFEDFYAK